MSGSTTVDGATARRGVSSAFDIGLRQLSFILLCYATITGAAAAFAQTPATTSGPEFLLSDQQLKQAMQMPGQKPVAASAVVAMTSQRNQATAASGGPPAAFTIEPLALPTASSGSTIQVMRVTVTGVPVRPGAAAYALFANGKSVAYGIESADLKSLRFIVRAELLPAGVALAIGKAPNMPTMALTPRLEMQQR